MSSQSFRIRHPEHGQFSVAEMLEHELPQLMPMPEPFDGYVENPARVSSIVGYIRQAAIGEPIPPWEFRH